MYHNIKTGLVLMPELRPGPESQQRELVKALWSGVSESSASLQVGSTSDWSITRGQYRFYARYDGIHKLFVLLASDAVKGEEVAFKVEEILTSIRKFYDL
jgi:hypothetical protein